VPEDAPRLLEIYGHYVAHTAVSFECAVPSLAVFTARLENIRARFPYLVAETEGRVLGYAYAAPLSDRAAYDWSCETTIYLDPEARRQGLGRMLYEALENWLREMGIQNLYARVAAPETPDEYLDWSSARFHRRMGYIQAGILGKSGCKFGRWYDMLWMEKHIGPHFPDPPPVRFLNQK
jgi:L-amino acid N-acyltransferase YncA